MSRTAVSRTTTSNDLSDKEREMLKAFLRLSAQKSDACANEEKLLTSLAMACRRLNATN